MFNADASSKLTQSLNIPVAFLSDVVTNDANGEMSSKESSPQNIYDMSSTLPALIYLSAEISTKAFIPENAYDISGLYLMIRPSFVPSSVLLSKYRKIVL